jgi:UDP-3-O-[3-hydroxymyristoyl] glucosamine N-acyltransferase
MRKMTKLTVQQICERVGGDLEGPGGTLISGIETIDKASPDQMTFIGAKRYASKWNDSKAAAAFVQRDIPLQPGSGRTLVRVSNADLAVAQVLDLFAPDSVAPPPGIHPSAVLGEGVLLGKNVAIGAMCYIGPNTRIGDGTVLHPRVTILDESIIGVGCVLWPGVVIRERCVIGDGCILHLNVTIGADGFGYRSGPDGQSLVKIPQIGTVRLGRGVEIGANSCVDRGKFSETLIGDGTKIDNLCQVAHNVQIGRCVVMAAMSGLGGSTVVGDGAMIGGGVVVKDHITIGAGARLGGGSPVMDDVPPGESWFGHPARNAMAAFRELAVIRQLPELAKTVKRLEQQSQKNDED